MLNTGLSIDFILNVARSYVAKAHAAHTAEHGGTRKIGHPWQATSAIDDIQWYEGRAGDDASLPVITGNWNTVDEYDRDQCVPERVLLPGGDVMARLGAIFEKIGLDVDWSDGISGCDECYRAIQTQPDSYGWRPEFVVGDGWISCSGCMADTGAWQAELDASAHSQSVVSVADVDPSEHGYTAIRELCFGFDGGHDEARLKSDMGNRAFFLQVTNSRQFGASYTLWVPNDDVADLPDEIEGSEIE